MVNIVVETSELAIAEELKKIQPEDIHIVRNNSLDGDPGEFSVLVILSALIIRQVSRIIVSAIESKKYIKVKARGIEIEGVSEKSLPEVIAALESIMTTEEKKNE